MTERSFRATQEMPVPVTGIEKALEAHWRSAGAGEPDAVVRASTVTLVVVVEGGAQVEDVRRTVERTCRTRPCRVVVVAVDPASTAPRPEAVIRTATQCCAGDRIQMSLEEVVLSASPAALPAVPSLVAALLLPDVPVVVWARGDQLLETALMARIVDEADRVILDSRTFRDPARAFRAALALRAGRREPPILCDVGWARLLPWREAVAQAFDPPGVRAGLPRITNLSATVAAPPGADGRMLSQGALLLGSFGAALGIETESRAWPAADSGLVLRGRSGAGEVEFRLRPDGSSLLQNGRIGSVELAALRMEPPVRVKVGRIEGRNAMTVRVEAENACRVPRMLHLPEPREFELIGEQMGTLPDPLLRPAVAAALAFL